MCADPQIWIPSTDQFHVHSHSSGLNIVKLEDLYNQSIKEEEISWKYRGIVIVKHFLGDLIFMYYSQICQPARGRSSSIPLRKFSDW